MKIHAIQTGTVAIKARQREGVGHGIRRQLNTLTDREWTEALPILAFAIEHPEGVIVIDTGETARAGEPGYFPRWHPYYRFGVREWVEPEQEIGPRLEQLGIAVSDVSKVVMTHLHTDHAGGLHHFPGREILVHRAEIDFASGRMGRVRGYPNNRFPSWLDPKPIDLEPAAVGPFPQSRALTAAGDVLAVPLPGHTPGHIGVLIRETDCNILIGGDSSYSQELMLAGSVDGIAPDEAAARLTIEWIQALAGEAPTVYLPSHDPETATRLDSREPVPSGDGRLGTA